MASEKILFDGNNPKLLRDLMKEHGNAAAPFFGTNNSGEETETHIANDTIIHKTYQKNGWLRINFYDANGLPSGEMFDGKWR